MCFGVLCDFYVKHFLLHAQLNEIRLNMYSGLHVKYLLFLSDFNETGIFSTDFEKRSKIKFHEILSSGSRVVQWGRTDGLAYGQTEMTKIIVVFRNFAKAPKILLNLLMMST